MSVRLAGRMGAPRDSMAKDMNSQDRNLQTEPKQTADWENKLEEQKSYDFSDDSDDGPIDREDQSNASSYIGTVMNRAETETVMFEPNTQIIAKLNQKAKE